MSNSPYVRSAFAQAALELATPLVRSTLIRDKDFREEYGFSADAVLSFGNYGVSIQRSELFVAIRALLSERQQFDVEDKEGRKWRIRKIGAEGDLPTFRMARAKQRLILPNFCVLSPDRRTRLRALDEAAADVNLPAGASDRWRDVLSRRALEDAEFDEYHRDLRETPAHVAVTIQGEIQDGKSSISSLVPHSRRYFERLVGKYDGSRTVRDYASGGAKEHFGQLSAWCPYEGFLFSLFLSSHASLTAEISVEKLGDDDLVNAFNFLEENGDRISQLGGIEVGLRILPSRPAIAPVLERLVGCIRDDNVDLPMSSFSIFSTLYIFVDGELSRTRVFATEPPFYRRLAALSQAALVHRQLVNTDVDWDQFSEWALEHRAGQFYHQSLADMRVQPRWQPDFAAASQMKAEFFGRIMIAANNYKKNITSNALASIVLETGPGSLHVLSDFFQPYLPGPLEGDEESQNILPPDMAETIKVQLAADEVGPSSFIALVNSSLIFRVGQDQAKLAAKALKFGNYRLTNVGDRSQLLAVLNGLGLVAAATRSHELADKLRIMVRRYMRDAQYALSVSEAVGICVVAGASRTHLNDWRDFVGDWLNELAFGDLTGNDGEVLYKHLRYLCHVVPELWVSCGRADAALMAYNAR